MRIMKCIEVRSKSMFISEDSSLLSSMTSVCVCACVCVSLCVRLCVCVEVEEEWKKHGLQ